MPDLQSELNKINQTIANWETTNPPAAPTGRTFFQTTNNVTRRVFEYVRDNPGVRRIEAIKALEKEGFKPGSTSSLLAQMTRQGLLASDNSRLTATQAEYTPLKGRLIRAGAKTKAKTKPAKETPKKLELTPGDKAMLQSIQVTPMPTLTPEYILSKLSVLEAKAVYDELRKIFGG